MNKFYDAQKDKIDFFDDFNSQSTCCFVFFSIFEKMQAILLYWFAAAQYFLQFIAKFNELSLKS